MSYPFADRAAEDERLVAQGRVFDPFTRRLLAAAGLRPGMRVLDLGSGAGNVARIAAELVGPAGVVCMEEADLQYLPASPTTPLWSEIHGYFLLALEKAGIERRKGLTLFTAFRAAGLPVPQLLVEAFAAGGPQAPAWAWANVVSAAVPLMERLGVATRADIDPTTLVDRLLAETLASDGYVIGPPMTGAWSTPVTH